MSAQYLHVIINAVLALTLEFSQLVEYDGGFSNTVIVFVFVRCKVDGYFVLQLGIFQEEFF